MAFTSSFSLKNVIAASERSAESLLSSLMPSQAVVLS